MQNQAASATFGSAPPAGQDIQTTTMATTTVATTTTATTTATVMATTSMHTRPISANSAQIDPRYGRNGQQDNAAVFQDIIEEPLANAPNDSGQLQSTFDSPDFSSLTAQNVRLEYRNNNPQQNVQPRVVPQEVVDSAVGLRQVQIMQTVEDRLRVIVPQIVAESLRSFSINPANIHLPWQGQAAAIWTQVQQPAIHPNGHSYVAPNQAVGTPPLAPPVERQFNPEPAWVNPEQRQQQSFVSPEGNQAMHDYEQSFRTRAPRPMNPSYNRKPFVERWGIKFDGTCKTMSAEDFVFRVETLQRDYNCSENEILTDFHHLLTGEALDWYWLERQHEQINRWGDLRNMILRRYRRFESDFEVQRKIMDRRQLPQESFEDYCNAILKLYNQQRQKISEDDLVEMMKCNLRPALAQLVFPIRMFGLSHFRIECRKAETLLQSQRQAFNQRQYVPRVNELDYTEPDEPNMEVHAISNNPKYVCWNCRQQGHGFMECPAQDRRLFCFKCGFDNTTSPKCPRCSGNKRSDPTKAGEARPKPRVQ